MALTENQMMFAYYVIATVESGCNYAAVNQTDAITLGIIQFYGQNAYNLLVKIKDSAPDSYELLSDRLKGFAEGGPQTWNYWTNVFLINDDAESWANAAQLDSNHTAQDEFSINYLFGTSGSYETMRGWGLSDDPKIAIFYMSIYHQRPVAAQQCMGQLGGNPTLLQLKNWCLSNQILGNYANRYNKVYDMLNKWDGMSGPPDDFGNSDIILPSDPPITGVLQSTVSYVQERGNDLVIVGNMTSTDRLLCHNTGKGIWLPVSSTIPNNPTEGEKPGGSMPPASPDDPADFPCMRQLWFDHAGEFAYGNGPGRFNPLESGYTDCSGGIHWAITHCTGTKYDWMGKGSESVLNTTYIVDHQTSGFHLDESIMRPGDMILMDLIGFEMAGLRADHRDWYMGGGVIWTCGYGGAPYPRFLTNDLENWYTNKVNELWVCRFLD